MGIVLANMSMSLDGYIAGPNDGVGNGLGDGGERLHQWMYDQVHWSERPGVIADQPTSNAAIRDELFAHTGAFVVGRRMFNNGERPWGDNPPFHVPVFVLTHNPRDRLVKEGGTSYSFVTDGIESALAQAKAAAGDKDVALGGGANAIQGFINAGLLDELRIHLVPVPLGGGIRLFDPVGPRQIELELTRVIDAPTVTHLKYRVVK